MRARPKLRAENFSDADTAAKVLNTVVLQPLYQRLDALERRQFIEVRVKTPTPAGALFPLVIPAPTWQVLSLQVAQVYNNTTRTAESIVAGVGWLYDDQGRLSVQTMTLVDANDYTLRFKAEG